MQGDGGPQASVVPTGAVHSRARWQASRPTPAVWLLLAATVLVAIVLRWHNIFAYNSWWADDGGAHLRYVQTILDYGRLPSAQDSYLAWHEPLYYIVVAGWQRLGEWVGLGGLNWWELLQVGVGMIFLAVVWQFAMSYRRDRWLALLSTFTFAFLFSSLKLSTYVTNELPAQALMLLAADRWLRWELHAPGKLGRVLLWSGLVLLAVLTKLTAVIVVAAAMLWWCAAALRRRQWYPLAYAALCAIVVGVGSLPWFAYKQRHFGTAFTINQPQRQNAQPLVSSAGWPTVITFEPRIFTAEPFFTYASAPSFSAVALADTFGDYYNLYTNVEAVSRLPAAAVRLTRNGRPAPLEHWSTMLSVNRLGFVIGLIWLVGLLGAAVQACRAGSLSAQRWLLLLTGAGAAALLFHWLRYPYLERGVIKVSFVYFTLPIAVTLAAAWWREVLRRPWQHVAVLALPMVTYVIVAWPILWV